MDINVGIQVFTVFASSGTLMGVVRMIFMLGKITARQESHERRLNVLEGRS